MWNLWHGCHKHSAGCANCYVYRIDGKHGRSSSEVKKTANFDLPIQRKKRTGEYKIPPGETVYTCFTSDFFVEDADQWRPQAWDMIRERSDLQFMMLTKRIERLSVGLPENWGDGWDHVTIVCTVENQDRADFRMPLYMAAPIKHKMLACEPLLGPLNLEQWLDSSIEMVMVGGESGYEARVCNYDWVLDIRRQCVEKNIPFRFRQTGTHLVKDGALYKIRRHDHFRQARKADINYK